MLMMKKPTDDLPAIKKKPEYMESEDTGTESDREPGGSDAELAAQDFIDAIKSGDAKGLVEAFIALDTACDMMSGEEEEEVEEGPSEEKGPGGIISVILGKGKKR
jgi:hypothetical protein